MARRITSRGAGTFRTQEPASAQGPAKPRTLWLGLALVIMTVSAYWPALQAGYIWDDNSYLTDNPVVLDSDGWRRAWIPRQTPQYYPLVFLSFWLEHRLWGVNPLGYHLVNVLVHVASALMLWRACAWLRLPGAWVIGAVFALHPVHVESVAWITERKNVLSAFFYLASTLCFFRFENLHPAAEPGAKRVGSPTRNLRWYVAALALFVCALLSKTTACSLPAALLAAQLYPRRPITFAWAARLAPFVLIGAAMGLHTAYLERMHVMASGPDWDYSLLERCLIASRVLLFYPWKLLWPSPLIFMYPKWAIEAQQVAAYWPVAVVAGLMIAAALAWRRGWRAPGAALLLYVAAIFPALGFFNIYPMLYSFVADHFQYVASIGPIALAVGGATTALRGARIAPLLAVAVLGALGALTFFQCHMYHDGETLWRWTIRHHPDAWMAHNNLGNYLRRAGQFDQAERHFRRTIELQPQRFQPYANLGDLLFDQARFGEALVVYRRLEALQPETAPSHYRLGRTFDRLGDEQRAEAEYRRAIELDPAREDPRLDLAGLCLRQRRFTDAGALMGSILSTDPFHPVAHLVLGEASLGEHRWHDALGHLETAQAHARSEMHRLEAELRLAELLASCPSDAVRDGQRARTLAERLNTAMRGQDPAALDVLAMALAELGLMEEAQQTGHQAARLARERGDAALEAAIQVRVQRYEQGLPWREPEQ